MEFGAKKYCTAEAAKFQDKINHFSVEPLGKELQCAIGKHAVLHLEFNVISALLRFFRLRRVLLGIH